MRLKAWYENLPSALSINDTTPRRLSSVGYLHLAYYNAEITLHHAILRTHSHTLSLSLLPPNDIDIYTLARNAANTRFTTALAFVTSLKPEHLQSFWYFSSSLSLAIIGIFASILRVTSTDQEEREAHIAHLAEYRWILRISSTGADFMKYAVGVLDTVSQLLDEDQKRKEEMRSDEFSPTFADSVPSINSPGNELDWNQQRFDIDLNTFDAFNIDSMFAFGDAGE